MSKQLKNTPRYTGGHRHFLSFLWYFFGISSGLHSPCFARFTTCVPEVVILPQVPYMSLEWSMLLVHIVQSHHNALLVVSNFLTTILYTYHSNVGVQLRRVTTQSPRTLHHFEKDIKPLFSTQ
jgi:hypothetical protein